MTTLNGLPAHVLLVHAIVVLLPLASLLLVLSALWPAARRKLAGPNALLSVLVLILVPITTDAGDWLEHRVASTPLVRAHTDLGDTALFVAIPVAVLALIVWWRQREFVRTAAADAVPADAAPEEAVPVGAASDGPGAAKLATRPALTRRAFLAPASTVVTVVVAVLSVVAAGAAVYDIYRIGDSGAQASWQGQFSPTPAPGGHG
ncbi:hypothetical protein [Amycolatopsis sp. NBC_01480]|jgi:hypothetical protein|uniref:hypothetical protein n=1 Tax=Amycolatopsis sp. NBC_01480 TaxID=2903562 RepID=UPI002E2BD434|nr:hypothetical protein [Amycolatopsis sp. NBC_01480]